MSWPCTKYGHASVRAAKRYRTHLREVGVERVEGYKWLYRCRACKRWHWTSMPPAEYAATKGHQDRVLRRRASKDKEGGPGSR